MRRTTLAVLAVAVTAACAPEPAAVEPLATPEPPTWGACPDDVQDTSLECATIDVPLDYRDPGGRTIEIAISRLASAKPAQRRGVLLTNSGGPGGPGLGFPAKLRELGLPQTVLDSYDVIGIDPRGVGHSTPVTCELTAEQQTSNIPPYAADDAAVAARAKDVEVIAEQCGSSASAAVLPHISTANTARDLDQVRAALGEKTASYLGVSYGTYLGSVYTTLFPDTTDRVLLDSAVGPNGWDVNHSRALGEGMEDRFPDFAAFAAAHPKYGLGATPAQVQAKYHELGARLDRTPSPDGVTGVMFRQTTFSMLYYDTGLPGLAQLWQVLDTGTPLPGAGEAVEVENYLASQLHVLCNDSDWPESVVEYQRNVATDRVSHPLFGAAGANITPCAYWPVEPTEPAVEITDDGPSNVLIMQNLRDPATPLSGARELRAAFGDRARMITADQGGHLAYLYLPNPCADDPVTAFLVTGERPADDLDCGPGPA
ncbi:alpha/beta hydrolase [Actinophytocola sediminis]